MTWVAASAGGVLAGMGTLLLAMASTTAADPGVLFAGGYTALGVLVVAVALVSFRVSESHRAIAMVSLYVCTVVTGDRVCALCFAVITNIDYGLYRLDWGAIAHVRTTSLVIAWPFMALAGHCFISASGSLAQLWRTPCNRMAVVLCGVILCGGFLSPVRLYGNWHEWFTKDLARMVESRNEACRQTDVLTEQLIKEYSDDWQVYMVRANYLLDVGRSLEGRDAAAKALRLLPPAMEPMRAGILVDMERMGVQQ